MRDNLTIVYARTAGEAISAARTLRLPKRDIICIGRRTTSAALRGIDSARTGQVFLIGDVTLKGAHQESIKLTIHQAAMFRVTPMGYVR